MTGRRHAAPPGWSKWVHREHGGEYTALTIARGTGPDQGVEFVYYLGLDAGTQALAAFVLRLDEWHDHMRPLEAAAAEDLDDFDLGGFDDFDLEL
ncbi:hypothetical protein [Billgrantia desiderata]|uniref:hypothetical protein n=1 Tax=Billgrantia desiderata TaxID=52021 RepID=UPI001F2983CA|nr:hypothetical protein [Halomonas desiderata]MCE8012857.1 hypothetical protein [Halomonas desiderata]